MTGANGVLVGGVLGAATGGGGGAASVNNKASTDSCVNVMAWRAKPDWMSHNKTACNASTISKLGKRLVGVRCG